MRYLVCVLMWCLCFNVFGQNDWSKYTLSELDSICEVLYNDEEYEDYEKYLGAINEFHDKAKKRK